MAEKLVDVVAKLRQRGKKDQPRKLLCDIKMAFKRRYLFFFFFFGKMPKIWAGRKTLSGEEKGDGLTIAITAALQQYCGDYNCKIEMKYSNLLLYFPKLQFLCVFHATIKH